MAIFQSLYALSQEGTLKGGKVPLEFFIVILCALIFSFNVLNT